jgi:hypothetical protein
MRRLSIVVVLLALSIASAAQELRLPGKEGSVKFAVIGDSGEPGKGQTAIAAQMANWRSKYPFEFVLMLGDNLYGTERPNDYQKKFEIPYKALLSSGVSLATS